MSANINYNEQLGRHSFVSNKEPAWHKLGTIVDHAMTSSEAIELAGLNYTVDTAKVAAVLKPKPRYINNLNATYRTDTNDIFGVVSDKYEVVQNSRAFEFMDSIVGKDKAIYETAGALGLGETVFVTAKLPYYIKINGHDTIENYLVVSNGHDGKTSLNIFMTPIRVVCANTLAVGLENNKFRLKLRHTSNINSKLDDASKLLNISSSISNNMEKLFKSLANIKVEDEVAEQYFNTLFLTSDELNKLANENVSFSNSNELSGKKKKLLKNVNDFYRSGVGQSKIIGTAYGTYNAVNGYLSNDKNYTNDSKRMESLVLGGTDFKLNNKALILAKTLLV